MIGGNSLARTRESFLPKAKVREMETIPEILDLTPLGLTVIDWTILFVAKSVKSFCILGLAGLGLTRSKTVPATASMAVLMSGELFTPSMFSWSLSG